MTELKMRLHKLDKWRRVMISYLQFTLIYNFHVIFISRPKCGMEGEAPFACLSLKWVSSYNMA